MINAEKVVFTGNKLNEKEYQHVTGYPGGQKIEIAKDLLSNSNVHLDDIAATLGYAAVTPFMRTFRRWSGTTPGQWRRSVRSEERATAA